MQNQKVITSPRVIDLISKKHRNIRGNLSSQVEDLFSEQMSVMDIYLLSLVRGCPISISESARHMGITRQGAHKHAKKLKDLKFIQLSESEFNKREKLIELTASGEDACAKIDKIKHDMEEELESRLGETAYNQVKLLLQQDW